MCAFMFCVFHSTSFIRSSEGAVTVCPISPQTVMSVTCQPSLAPAVPRGSVAPATCPFNQNDPGVTLGEMHGVASHWTVALSVNFYSILTLLFVMSCMKRHAFMLFVFSLLGLYCTFKSVETFPEFC